MPLLRRERLLHLTDAVRLVWSSAPGWTVLQTVFTAAQGVLPGVSVYLTKHLVDATTSYLEAASSSRDIREPAFYAGAMAAIGVVSRLCQVFGQYVTDAQASAVSIHVLGVLQDKSAGVDLAYYESPAYYDKMRLAHSQAVSRPTGIVKDLATFVRNAVTLISVGGVLAAEHAYLLPVLLVAVLPAVAVRVVTARRRKRWHSEIVSDERRASYLHLLLTSGAYAKESRLYGYGGELRQAFRWLRKHVRASRLSMLLRHIGLELGADLLGGLAVGAGAVAVYMRMRMGSVSLGDLALLFRGFVRARASLRAAFGSLASLYEDAIFIAHYYEFMALPTLVSAPDAPAPVPTPLVKGIELQGVTFRYAESMPVVLRDVSFRIRPGEHVAFVGENGAGKTTLVKLLCRFYDPCEGEIRWDGTSLRDFDPGELRRACSALFQDYVQYQFAAGESIRLGDVRVPPGDDRIRQAAVDAGADELIRALPDGYDTILGRLFEGGRELSVGQWQRIALARTFLRDAPIVILDEPTSALDARAEHEVFQRFLQLVKGKTAIVISHRLWTVRTVDRIFVLDRGRLVESGPHDELVARDGLYARLYSLQARHFQ